MDQPESTKSVVPSTQPFSSDDASYKALAVAYRANGQVKEAVALLEQVVAIHKRVLAKRPPQTSDAPLL